MHKTSASTPGRTSAAGVRFCTRWLERLAVHVSSLPCKNGPVRKRNLAHMFGTTKLDDHRRLFFATQIWYSGKKKTVLALSPLANHHFSHKDCHFMDIFHCQYTRLTSQAQPDTLAHGSQLCLREHGGTPGDDTGEPG